MDADWVTGLLLEEVPTEGDQLKPQGSAMIALASSKEEILQALKKNIYATNDVWDFSKVSLYILYETRQGSNADIY